MILVIGDVMTSPETAAEVTRLCTEHSAHSRQEPGCLAHNVHAGREDAGPLVFVEQWVDSAALKAHFAVPESRVFVRAVRALSQARTVMRLYTADELPSAD